MLFRLSEDCGTDLPPGLAFLSKAIGIRWICSPRRCAMATFEKNSNSFHVGSKGSRLPWEDVFGRRQFGRSENGEEQPRLKRWDSVWPWKILTFFRRGSASIFNCYRKIGLLFLAKKHKLEAARISVAFTQEWLGCKCTKLSFL